MYRIRFHGRGGQGVKTAGRLLGTALFLQGFEVQDAPRYGAERRGAPIFAYVRAGRQPIYERGVVRRPDLVVVTDQTLVGLAVAGVGAGADTHTVTLINSPDPPETWKGRLQAQGTVVTLPRALSLEDAEHVRLVGAACAGAAARLLGVVKRKALEAAIREELGALGPAVVERNLTGAFDTYDAMATEEGLVLPAEDPSAVGYTPPDWIDLPFDDADISAPAIHAAATSVEVRTGLWRTMRPVLDRERCSRCWWNCVTSCPDGVITVDQDGYPVIDYDHCKGCLICSAQCRRHALRPVSERRALAAAKAAADMTPAAASATAAGPQKGGAA